MVTTNEKSLYLLQDAVHLSRTEVKIGPVTAIDRLVGQGLKCPFRWMAGLMCWLHGQAFLKFSKQISGAHDHKIKDCLLSGLECCVPFGPAAELAYDSIIGSVADFHYSFMGAADPAVMETAAEKLAGLLTSDKVDAALPVISSSLLKVKPEKKSPGISAHRGADPGAWHRKPDQ